MPENVIKKIMENINNDKVKPRSKYYFLAGFVLLISGTLSLFTICIFFINTLFYSYSGFRNSFSEIDTQLPWPAFLITLISFAFGIFLFRKFEISYTNSFIVLSLILLITVFSAGYFLSKTNVNQSLLSNRTYKKMYMMTLQEADWVQGIILEIKQNKSSILIKDTVGNQIIVTINQQTVQPNRSFIVGDCIKAAGTMEGNVLVAKGLSRCGMGNGMGGGGMMRNRNSN